MEFSAQITNWYKKNKRDLPWRKTSDPYKIWLSEVILQQTQVNQGLPYYERFVVTFPSVQALAQSDENEVLKLWQGLGYYSRARNLHFAAKQVVSMGQFPKQYDTILSLKGVGEYTAAAIASFAFDLPHAVVDGNVFRLLSRYFGIEKNIQTSGGKKHFNELAHSLLNKQNPAIHNQAIMEFGSQMCKPVQPHCTNCLLQQDCYAFNHQKVSYFPVKNKKKNSTKVFHDYFFLEYNQYTFIQKRQNDGIWKNLYEFPLIENTKQLSKDNILKHPNLHVWLKEKKINVKSIKSYKHILSHRLIFARFWHLKCYEIIKHPSLKKVDMKDLDNYAVSRLTEKYLHDISI